MCRINQLKLAVEGLLDQLSSKRHILDARLGEVVIIILFRLRFLLSTTSFFQLFYGFIFIFHFNNFL